MKSYLAILALISLMGCSTTKPLPPVVVTKTEYITKLPPAELLTIPDPIPLLTDPITQSDVANWIIKQHNRSAVLENNLNGIGNFYKDSK